MMRGQQLQSTGPNPHGAVVNDPAVFGNTGVHVTINSPGYDGVFAHQYNVIQYLGNLVGVELGMRDDSFHPGTMLAYYIAWLPDAAGILAESHGVKKLDAGVPHQFDIVLDHGTTWAVQIDGHNYAKFNAGDGATHSAVNGLSVFSLEEGGPLPVNEIDFSDFQYRDVGGAWHDMPTGFSFGSGVEGNLQDASIPPAAFDLGGSIVGVGPNTELWIA